MRLKQIYQAEQRRVVAVASDGGACDLLDFLTGLKRDRSGDFKGIYDLFKQAANCRIPSRSEHVKNLGDGILEFKKGDARVLWFEDGKGRIIVCSHGFIKKSRETPDGELNLARTRKEQYFRDKTSGNLFPEWEQSK